MRALAVVYVLGKIAVWIGQRVASFVRAAYYRADRIRRLGLARPRPPALAAGETERFWSEAERLRDETLWMIEDLERQLVWRAPPRYFVDDYEARVAGFLERIDALPDDARHDLLDAGVSVTRLQELAPLRRVPGDWRGDLLAQRASRIAFTQELQRCLRLTRALQSGDPYRRAQA